MVVQFFKGEGAGGGGEEVEVTTLTGFPQDVFFDRFLGHQPETRKGGREGRVIYRTARSRKKEGRRDIPVDVHLARLPDAMRPVLGLSIQDTKGGREGGEGGKEGHTCRCAPRASDQCDERGLALVRPWLGSSQSRRR